MKSAPQTQAIIGAVPAAYQSSRLTKTSSNALRWIAPKYSNNRMNFLFAKSKYVRDQQEHHTKFKGHKQTIN